MRLRWERDVGRPTRRSHNTRTLGSFLYVGDLEPPVAVLRPSSSGATFYLSTGSLSFELRLSTPYLPLERAEAEVEEQVRAWFASALAPSAPDTAEPV